MAIAMFLAAVFGMFITAFGLLSSMQHSATFVEDRLFITLIIALGMFIILVVMGLFAIN